MEPINEWEHRWQRCLGTILLTPIAMTIYSFWALVGIFQPWNRPTQRDWQEFIDLIKETWNQEHPAYVYRSRDLLTHGEE